VTLTPDPGPGAEGEPEIDAKLAYLEHAPFVRRCALRLTAGDSHAAEDAVQETFVDIVRTWPRFRDLPPAARRPWLFTTVKRRVIDGWRATQRQLAGDPADPLPEQPDPLSGEDTVLDGISAAAFWKELTVLPERAYRTAYLLWHENWDISKTARHLGVDRATVYRDRALALDAARRSKNLGSGHDEERGA
jgi:RNA polymerase sigma factor (sigma-70 family)